MDGWILGIIAGLTTMVTVLTWVICDTRNQLNDMRAMTENTKDRVIDAVMLLHTLSATPQKKGKPCR